MTAILAGDELFLVTFVQEMNILKSKLARVALHIICCIGFLALPIVFAPDQPVYWFQFNNYALNKFFTYSLFIGFFYLNFFLLVPRLYFRRQYVLYLICCVAGFFIITYLPGYVFTTSGMETPVQATMPPGAAPAFSVVVEQSHFEKPFMMPHISDNFFLFLIVLFVSLSLKINQQLRYTEKEKAMAQLSYLQAQINPHFLFNTLNSIYSLSIDEKARSTSTAIVKLSGLMRYVTTESDTDLVPLEKEINYISNYVDLQKIRLGNTAQINYSTEGDTAGKWITPLLLIAFIENAFKHGVNPEEQSPIHIALTVVADELTLYVCNNKVTRTQEEKSHVGIRNTRNRLELLYPGRHTLNIVEANNTYQVTLKIRMT